MGLFAGAPAPFFVARSHINPKFDFSSLGGRFVLLAFLPEPGPERDRAMLLLRERRSLFASDNQTVFFGVLPDVETFEAQDGRPPLRWFADPEGQIRQLYGAEEASGAIRPEWCLIDPSLRVVISAPLAQGEWVMEQVAQLPSPADHAAVPLSAPVLIVPRIFEIALCQRLIAYHAETGGFASGVMRELDGRTIRVLDDFKRRRDAVVEDAALRSEISLRLSRRLLPQIAKAFQFQATRIERYLIGCYDSKDGGYFRAHRDNTTPGTAHRKFAVSINLNAEAFEGGDLMFPEFGPRRYRPPTGGAVVFSCALLHEATPVTHGQRFAFLPFLYDEQGEAIREANLASLEPETQTR